MYSFIKWHEGGHQGAEGSANQAPNHAFRPLKAAGPPSAAFTRLARRHHNAYDVAMRPVFLPFSAAS